MKYLIEIDKAGSATLQIDDQQPVRLSRFEIKAEREPVINREKSDPQIGFIHYKPGPTGRFTVEAEIDYSAPGEQPAAERERERVARTAKAIFDWLTTNECAPYSFNEDESDFTVSVDGILDCKALAKNITP